ncbi:MAG: DEAD/DEAH box helicase [Planctomycetota bacterium]|nr:DEAD/DEAH box helicase [Planctomycetota bacterium]
MATQATAPFDRFLSDLTQDRHYHDQVVHVKRLAARPARFADPAAPLPEALARGLAAMGVQRLYVHQARALDLARAGKDFVIVTGTASGKTMCYNLPVLERLLKVEPQFLNHGLTSNPWHMKAGAATGRNKSTRSPRRPANQARLIDDAPSGQGESATALYLFPTKALAQDQRGTLARWADADPAVAAVLRPATYDGDTPQHSRRRIRTEANVILSNPDMLHVGILPYHPRWSSFFQNLRYVVVDELHQYRGIFGSNVALVMRRLARVCAHYGSRPQFICASATIANPGELAQALTGRACEVLDEDGSPRGPRLFVLWNPPLLGTDGLARRSAAMEATDLLCHLVERGVQTIVFTKARVVAELVYRYARERLGKTNKALADKVRAYRGGYLPQERRAIEKALFGGDLLGIASTNALELGIDVGTLDASILLGFPGTIASTWQQAGRAGRGREQALTVLVAYNDPIDQYLMHHPECFFGRPVESAVVDPDNPYILANHLGCAAAELPLAPEDKALFGPRLGDVAAILADGGDLTPIDDRYYWSKPESPSQKTDLRTISSDTFSIVRSDAGRKDVIGQVDSISAPELVYPNAIYLHEGESHIVRQLDFEGKVAYVQRAETDYYTQPVLADKCRIRREDRSKRLPGLAACFGDLTVTWATVALKKIKYYTGENIGQTALDLPSQTLETTGLWMMVDDAILEDLRAAGLKAVEGLVGVRNLALVCLPMLAMCDRRDLSGIVESANTGCPTAFIYDRFLGGLGFAEKGYERLPELLAMCRRLAAECECESGCPSCVGLANLRPPVHQDPDLMHGYAIPSKEAALALLERLPT